MSISDGRYKNNVKENVAGLEFIKRLRPVSYNDDVHGLIKHVNVSKDKRVPKNSEEARQNEVAANKKESIRYTGFIAQEVATAVRKSGYEFSGVYTPPTDAGIYGLDYQSFVAPLVKSIQQLNKKIEDRQKEINELNDMVKKLLNDQSDKW